MRFKQQLQGIIDHYRGMSVAERDEMWRHDHNGFNQTDPRAVDGAYAYVSYIEFNLEEGGADEPSESESRLVIDAVRIMQAIDLLASVKSNLK